MTKNLKSQVEYWRNSAQRNWKTALSLFDLKHYDSCLFFCHLTLEKALKALVVQQINKPAPYIHDLAKLSEIAQLETSEDQTQNLRTITGFNMAARYDDVKLSFYKRCTREYTQKYLEITRKLYSWLKKQYLKK
ncbi:HEPN domain-containing protein [Patescibacteria group bacterium AH-259-L07]|nr:HEPN domain-containing protein [Patescibacteria group bacterium AH-259-L07]